MVFMISRNGAGPREKGYIEAGDRCDLTRVEQGCMPDDRRAPVMAEQDRLAVAKLIDHGSNVGRNVAQGIVGNFTWTGALSVTAHVKRSDRVSACSEIFDLVTPRVPEFWKTVYAYDQWTISGKGDIKFDGSVADADEIQKRLLIEFRNGVSRCSRS